MSLLFSTLITALQVSRVKQCAWGHVPRKDQRQIQMRSMPKPAPPADDKKPKQAVWQQAVIPKERRLCEGLLSIRARVKPFLKSEGKSGDCVRCQTCRAQNWLLLPQRPGLPCSSLGQALWLCCARECRTHGCLRGQDSILLLLARCGREPHRSNQPPKGVTLQTAVLESPASEGRGGQGTRGGKGRYCIFF